MERVIQSAEGRALAVSESGDLDGYPVLVHMGTPNSRRLYGRNVRDAAGRGLRLISYDRPGYGGSDADPGRTVADCVADVRAICSALGIERLAMWGISGGGPHVLACAALLPDLATAVASLASPAPYGAEGLDWFDGMGQDNVDDVRLMLADEKAARVKMDQDREAFLAASPEELAEGMKSLLSPVDEAVLTGELGEFMVYSMREGLAPGSQGWWDDSLAEQRPWGFDLAQISVPVLLLHGRHDQFVPFAHGQWLAAHIPGAEAWLFDDEGHLSLMENRVGDVHAWLASHR
jgi:pimeloyl-ACP methyl ester carboxylesterase